MDTHNRLSTAIGKSSVRPDRPLAKEIRTKPLGHGTIKIATNPRVSNGLRRAWKRIECLSVADYLQALTGAVVELKRNINYSGEELTNEFELLAAFDSAVRDGDTKRDYSVLACRLLVEEYKDMDAPFGDVEEAEAW